MAIDGGTPERVMFRIPDRRRSRTGGLGRQLSSAELAAPYYPVTSFWNLGLPRSGSKLGSIFSQPGDT